MTRHSPGRDQRLRAFCASLRAIRLLRGVSAQELGRRMGLSQRSYERFEAGEGRIDFERIVLFAEATDSDPLAIVCSLFLNRPEIGARFADNKLHWVFALALERFSDALGDRGRQLETAALINAFERAFDDVARLQDERDARARVFFASDIDPLERPR